MNDPLSMWDDEEMRLYREHQARHRRTLGLMFLSIAVVLLLWWGVSLVWAG